MLEYSEQEKAYLKEKVGMLEHVLEEEGQRRVNAERLDNFEEANRLFEEN